MARYDHLQLVRLPERFERRKHGGGSPPPNRDLAAHSAKLETELDAVIATQQRRRKAEFVDPSLILRVHMSGQLLEEQWEQLGSHGPFERSGPFAGPVCINRRDAGIPTPAGSMEGRDT